jgi:cytochrome c553
VEINMRISIAVPVSIAALSCFAVAAYAQETDVSGLATRTCASCHGPRGESVSPAFPRLAGQRPEYLDTQLKAFRDRTRADPMAQAYMWGMASQLSDDTIRGLADYYARQKPVHSKPASAALERAGKGIFENGIPDAKVQACVTCHGKAAEGTSGFPRLAGQHAEYIVKQLVLFKELLREEGAAPIMHGVSRGMSFEQMEAVAAYLASR